MSDTTLQLMETLARNFKQNRLESMAEFFVFPLPFYGGDNLQVFGAKCTFIELLQMYHDATRRMQVTDIVPRVLAEGLPVNGYSNVWVEWDHLDRDGHCLRSSQVHYVFYHAQDALFPKIELIEYTAMAYPELSENFAELRIA